MGNVLPRVKFSYLSTRSSGLSQAWNGYDPDPEFVAGLPAERAALLTGGDKYGWQRKLRDLAVPAETI